MKLLLKYALISVLLSACNESDSGSYNQLREENNDLIQSNKKLMKENEKLKRKVALQEIETLILKDEWQEALDLIKIKESEEIIKYEDQKRLVKSIDRAVIDFKNTTAPQDYLNLIGEWIAVYDSNLTAIDTTMIKQFETDSYRFSFKNLPFAKIDNERFYDLLQYWKIPFKKDRLYLVGTKKLRNNLLAMFTMTYHNRHTYTCYLLVLAPNQAIMDSMKIVDKYTAFIQIETRETRKFQNGIQFTSDSTFRMNELRVFYEKNLRTMEQTETRFMIDAKGKIIQQAEASFLESN